MRSKCECIIFWDGFNGLNWHHSP